MISDTMPTVALCQKKKNSVKCEKRSEPREDWRKNLVKVKKVVCIQAYWPLSAEAYPGFRVSGASPSHGRPPQHFIRFP